MCLQKNFSQNTFRHLFKRFLISGDLCLISLGIEMKQTPNRDHLFCGPIFSPCWGIECQLAQLPLVLMMMMAFPQLRHRNS